MKQNKIIFLEKNTAWFIKVYDNLIDKARKRGLDKSKLKGNYETHHIIPKCMNGTNDVDNLVLLTIREHYIAHKLLYRIHPEICGLLKAILIMSNIHGDILINSSRDFEYYKLQYIISDKHREKLSKSGKGKHYNFDKSHCDNISKGKKGKPYGSKVIDSDGNLFDTTSSCANYYGYCQSTIRFWILNKPEKGFRYYKEGDQFKNHFDRFGKLITEETINNNNHPRAKRILGPNGEIYQSMRECYEQTGHDRHTILDWIRNKPERGFKFIEK